MANWANPTLSSTYTNFLAELKARDDDLARGLDPAVATVTSPPVNAIRWNSASKKWQKWSGSAWGDLSASYAINVEGTLAAPAGSVGAPSIVFQGSATTGFYRPAADRVALAIAGVQRLWVGGTGRFSFGAGESPAGVVSIAGGNFVVQETSVNRALAFTDAAGSTTYGEFGSESASGANVAFVSNPRAGGTVALRVAGTNRLTVTDTAATFSVPISGAGSGLTALPAGQLTGVTAVANGGTGKATIADGALLIGNGTSAVDDYLVPVNAGEIVVGQETGIGPGSPIAWGKASFNALAKDAVNAFGAAPVYSCRAWLTFSNISMSGTYAQSGTTITVTMTAHGMAAGQAVYLDFTSGAGIDGYFIIFNVTTNEFSVTASNSQTTSGFVSRTIYVMRSGNISLVAVLANGVHRISFIEPLPDALYAWSGSVKTENTSPLSVICSTTNCTKTNQYLDVEIGNSSSGTNQASSEISVMVFR